MSQINKQDSLKDKITKLSNHNGIKKFITGVGSSSATKQLVIGSISGWATGCLSVKVGKMAAFAVGGGIILYQVAYQTKYVKSDWNEIIEKAQKQSQKMNTQKAAQLLSNVKRFSQSNTCFAAGFIGGFLIGLAT